MTNRRYLLVGSETAFGVPTGTPTHWIRALEDSLRSDQAHIYPEDTERADAVTSIPGPYRITGDIGGYAEPYYFGGVLERALGKWTASTIAAAGVYIHSIVATESDIQYFYVEKALQNLNSAIRYGGVKIGNIRLESRMGQPLMWTASLQSIKDSLVVQETNADVEAGYDKVLNPWMHHEIVLTHGADTLKLQTFQLNIRNKLTDAYYSARFSNEWEFEGREITGNLVLKNEDVDMLEKFFGADNLKRPEATTTPYAIVATYTTAYTIAAGHYAWLRFHLPRVDLNTESLRGLRRETETVEFPFKALYDRTLNYAIVATVKTTHIAPL